MKKRLKKSLIVVCSVILFLIIAVSAFLIWFYRTPYTANKGKIAAILPLPAAAISGNFIPVSEFASRLQGSENYYTEEQKPIPASLQNQVLQELIQEKETEIVAKKNSVSLSDKELDTQFNQLEQQLNQTDPNGFVSMVAKYGLSQNQFKEEVLSPNLLSTDLIIWFNSQRSLNPAQYSLADSIQNQSTSSSTFISLVKQYSQDPNTKDLEGDMGYLELQAVLPEFKGPLDAAKIGDTLVLASRYGIHILYIENKDMNGTGGSSRVHVRQIFLQPENFASWYDDQTKNFHVSHYLKT